MKILILSDNFLNGGMETHIEGYIENMKEHEFYLAVTNFKECDDNKKFFRGIKMVNFYDSKISETLLELQKFMFENKIDAIHSHTVSTYFIAALLAYRMNKPYFLTVHGPYTISEISSNWSASVRNRIFDRAAKVYVVSHEIKNLLAQLKINCEVISNSIDLNKFKYKEISHDSHRWALVSRLDYDKTPGIKNMLKMIEGSRIKSLDIYGTGNGAIDLFNMYKESNFSFELNLKGDCHDIDEALNTNYEGVFAMGRAALEALAKGYPVILIGYDSVKGLINEKNINVISYSNFSGRGILNISSDNLKMHLEDSVKNYKSYNLHDLIERDFNIKNVVEKYKNDLQIKKPLDFLFIDNDFVISNSDIRFNDSNLLYRV